MAEKVTKKRKSRGTRRQLKRRHRQLNTIAMCAFLFLCVGSFATVALMNVQSSRAPKDQWYVENGGMEILAPPAGSTLELGGGQAPVSLPFLQSTPEPMATEAPRPTLAPLPTPVAAPEQTMDVLQPEPTLEVTSVPITVTAVGDCTLGGNVPNGYDRYFARYVEKYGYDYFFANVRELFESDDLTIVNLEGPLTTSEDKRGGRTFNFRGRPDYVNILTGSSVEIANVANNHALDYGEAGFTETAEVLKSAGIGVSGFSQMYFEDVKGVRVCSLGFTEWAYSQEQIERQIELARPNCDLLLVSIHWGEEGKHTATATQKRLGRAMIDAGADIVIGNHSHVYGGVELYEGKYIIYSLGNFCFGGNTNPSDKNCAIFQQTFNVGVDGTVTDGGISIIPARISTSDSKNNYQPYILTGEAGRELVKKIGRVSEVDLSKALWMESSYQVANGMVTLGND